MQLQFKGSSWYYAIVDIIALNVIEGYAAKAVENHKGREDLWALCLPRARPYFQGCSCSSFLTIYLPEGICTD